MWLELQALLIIVNYIVEDVLVTAVGTILKLIKTSFIVYCEILKLKLYRSLLKIHFLINMWTSPNHRAFQAIVAYFINLDTCILQKALLALPELSLYSGED